MMEFATSQRLISQNFSKTLKKCKLLVQIRPPYRSVYNVLAVTGIRNVTRLRVGFSSRNYHRLDIT